MSIVPEHPHDRYLVSQSQMKVTLDPEKADPLFFYYVFSSSDQQENIRQNTVQTGVPHINLGILRSITVQLPKLSEQRAIAAALSDVDALINTLDKLIAKKRSIMLATSQQLLTGHTRLPGLTDVAKAQLKKRWGTMRKVESSEPRLKIIVDDILMDMETRDRLKSGHGNALLVSSSIYNACRFYEMFEQKGLAGKCAIITSYKPAPGDIKGEETGEGKTEKLRQYDIYRKMLADYFNAPENEAMNKVDQFELEVKRRFINEPGQMKLLIVVDKLLTGFDAPPATYLYIDKQMHDHGLFQAICRVNRLDSEDKEYGYVIDYKDLFKALEKSIHDYTGEAFGAYDAEDVQGLLTDRLTKSKEHLEELRESVKALCEPVAPPKDTINYIHYFCGKSGDGDELEDNEQKRVALYKTVAALLRAYADLANEMTDAGYSEKAAQEIKEEVTYYEKVREEIKLASGDYMKVFEPAMRHLLDTYIKADESKKLSAFDDMTLVQLVVDQGGSADSRRSSNNKNANRKERWSAAKHTSFGADATDLLSSRAMRPLRWSPARRAGWSCSCTRKMDESADNESSIAGIGSCFANR